jgi:uncharacterized protein YjeT (DUF2065 family)
MSAFGYKQTSTAVEKNMNIIAIVSIVLGTVIIVTRAPLIVAPQETVGFYRKVLEKPIRVRAIGLAFTALALVILRATADEPGTLATILYAFSWFILAGSFVVLILFPNVAKSLVDRVLGALNNTQLRVSGVVAVAFGIFLIYWGATW